MVGAAAGAVVGATAGFAGAVVGGGAVVAAGAAGAVVGDGAAAGAAHAARTPPITGRPNPSAAIRRSTWRRETGDWLIVASFLVRQLPGAESLVDSRAFT